MRKSVNRQFVLLAYCIAMLGLSGCAFSPEVDMSSAQIIDITSGYDETSLLETLADRKQLREPLVMKVPAGFPLPVAIRIKTPIAEMNSHCSTLHFRKDVFVYLSNTKMLISPDSKNWAPLHDMEEVKELFGGGRGEVNVQMSSSREMGPLLEVRVTVEED